MQKMTFHCHVWENSGVIPPPTFNQENKNTMYIGWKKSMENSRNLAGTWFWLSWLHLNKKIPTALQWNQLKFKIRAIHQTKYKKSKSKPCSRDVHLGFGWIRVSTIIFRFGHLLCPTASQFKRKLWDLFNDVQRISLRDLWFSFRDVPHKWFCFEPLKNGTFSYPDVIQQDPLPKCMQKMVRFEYLIKRPLNLCINVDVSYPE